MIDPDCPECRGPMDRASYTDYGFCSDCAEDTGAADLDAAMEIERAERVEREAFHYDDLHNDN